MIRVLLLHGGIIPHYRVPIYGYLSRYLLPLGFDLLVTSDGIQADNPHPIDFKYEQMRLSTQSIAKLIYHQDIRIIVDFLVIKHLYMFPTYFIAKGLMRRKMVYWGQGCDLLDSKARIKNLAYATEQALCDAIILYAEHLKRYIPRWFHKKTFVANNTLYIDYPGLAPEGRKKVLERYGIKTQKNIICMGRMQKRKRLDRVADALLQMNKTEVGLILVGPDPDGVLDEINGDRIYKLGPIYGDNRFDLLSAADVYCLPGAVGLSIIDAFYCGLPVVTEDGDESAEIMYLKDGVNGFIVPPGNIPELAQKLALLLDDDCLRKRFSAAAKREIIENGSMEKFCAGFRDALYYATGQKDKIGKNITK
jgi:glycosyltransferase involved in cell wall biosynthesis